jgi:Fe2+ or Zn2+ uptake regulation protein
MFKIVMKRMTNQKIIILEFLRKTKIHPTAEQVFLEVQKKLPRISQATVYRILDSFVKNGNIQSVAGKITRFDGNKQIHQHFICNDCNTITDIFDEKIEEYLNNRKSTVQNCRVESFSVDFRGQCEKCKN